MPKYIKVQYESRVVVSLKKILFCFYFLIRVVIIFRVLTCNYQCNVLGNVMDVLK